MAASDPLAGLAHAPPWAPDRPLTGETARAIIAATFPEIDVASVTHLGSGWEFDAYLTADGWVFRFPRRAESANLFEAEARVHRLVGAVLPPHVGVPNVERIGPPTLGFPYRFAGHRCLPGVAMDAIGERHLPTLARDLAEVLDALHSIPETDARDAGVAEMDVDEEGRRQWLAHGVAAAPSLRGLDPAVDEALRWLDQGSLPTSRTAAPLVLVHHDLSPEHVLVDPPTGFISGVLDWTDASLGDAARDFVFLATWRGWPFVEEVLRGYRRPVDDEFRVRLRDMARLLSVMWLVYAHEQGSDLTPHVRGVRHVFAAEPGPLPGDSFPG